jgi:23S rRNA (uridine2552-2'-O)-methyltransferase
MTRSKSSQRWLKEHFSDPYVKKAQQGGLRSRAAFKLEELLDSDVRLKSGMLVVDLGAAPGGWSQLIAARGKGQIRTIALDLLEMPALPFVEFIAGDFTSDEVLTKLTQALNGEKADLVLSDMAPNMTGVKDVDLPRSYHLAELALEFVQQWLKPKGTFLIKLFHGEGFDPYVRQLKKQFVSVKVRKPDASRDRSREIYAVATGFRVQ